MVLGGEEAVPQPGSVQQLGSVSNSGYFQKDGFPLERSSLQHEGLILDPLLKICLLGRVFLC